MGFCEKTKKGGKGPGTYAAVRRRYAAGTPPVHTPAPAAAPAEALGETGASICIGGSTESAPAGLGGDWGRPWANASENKRLLFQLSEAHAREKPKEGREGTHQASADLAATSGGSPIG